jgi:hypothetical protein
VTKFKIKAGENAHAYVIGILAGSSFAAQLGRCSKDCRWQTGEYSEQVVYGVVQVNVPPVRQRQGAKCRGIHTVSRK